MQINEALKIFDLQNDHNLDAKQLKQLFRKLAKENHPDLGGSKKGMQSIIDAYNLLKDYDSVKIVVNKSTKTWYNPDLDPYKRKPKQAQHRENIKEVLYHKDFITVLQLFISYINDNKHTNYHADPVKYLQNFIDAGSFLYCEINLFGHLIKLTGHKYGGEDELESIIIEDTMIDRIKHYTDISLIDIDDFYK